MKKRIIDYFELPSKDAEILRKQAIDENGPGTILKDFQTFLDFIQARSEELTRINRLLPLKSLPILNAKMTHPIKINSEAFSTG